MLKVDNIGGISVLKNVNNNSFRTNSICWNVGMTLVITLHVAHLYVYNVDSCIAYMLVKVSVIYECYNMYCHRTNDAE